MTRIFSYTYSSLPFNTLTNDNLVKFSGVNTLKLSNNNIMTIEPQAFKPVSNLLLLFLDNNPFITSHSVSFMPFLNPYLRLLSLKNVLAQHEHDECLWNFLTNCPQNEGRNNTRFMFEQLEELNLDHNRLTSINPKVFLRSKILLGLKTLGLAENQLNENDLLLLLKLLSKALVLRKVFKPTKNGDLTEENITFDLLSRKLTTKVIQNFAVDIKINFSQNRVEALNSTTLDFIETLLNSTFELNYHDNICLLKTLSLSVNLENNPWSCTCEIIPLNICLSNVSKRRFVNNWKRLRCLFPKNLAGKLCFILSGVKVERVHDSSHA